MRAMKRVLTIAGSLLRRRGYSGGYQDNIRTRRVRDERDRIRRGGKHRACTEKAGYCRPEIVRAQVDAIYEDIGTDAVKIGMLPTPDVSLLWRKSYANTVRRTSLLTL